MERLIDISNFFIVKPSHLNEIIAELNLNLSINSEVYLLTLILANIFAVLIIYLFIKLILFMPKKLFRRRKYMRRF